MSKRKQRKFREYGLCDFGEKQIVAWVPAGKILVRQWLNDWEVVEGGIRWRGFNFGYMDGTVLASRVEDEDWIRPGDYVTFQSGGFCDPVSLGKGRDRGVLVPLGRVLVVQRGKDAVDPKPENDKYYVREKKEEPKAPAEGDENTESS